MSVHAPQQTKGYEGYFDEDRGYGWVTFAGVLLMLLGTLNFIAGIAGDRQLAVLRERRALYVRRPQNLGQDRAVHRRTRSGRWRSSRSTFSRSTASSPTARESVKPDP
jgi:hypothetical protein